MPLKTAFYPHWPTQRDWPDVATFHWFIYGRHDRIEIYMLMAYRFEYIRISYPWMIMPNSRSVKHIRFMRHRKAYLTDEYHSDNIRTLSNIYIPRSLRYYTCYWVLWHFSTKRHQSSKHTYEHIWQFTITNFRLLEAFFRNILEWWCTYFYKLLIQHIYFSTFHDSS